MVTTTEASNGKKKKTAVPPVDEGQSSSSSAPAAKKVRLTNEYSGFRVEKRGDGQSAAAIDILDATSSR